MMQQVVSFMRTIDTDRLWSRNEHNAHNLCLRLSTGLPYGRLGEQDEIEFDHHRKIT